MLAMLGPPSSVARYGARPLCYGPCVVGTALGSGSVPWTTPCGATGLAPGPLPAFCHAGLISPKKTVFPESCFLLMGSLGSWCPVSIYHRQVGSRLLWHHMTQAWQTRSTFPRAPCGHCLPDLDLVLMVLLCQHLLPLPLVPSTPAVASSSPSDPLRGPGGFWPGPCSLCRPPGGPVVGPGSTLGTCSLTYFVAGSGDRQSGIRVLAHCQHLLAVCSAYRRLWVQASCTAQLWSSLPPRPPLQGQVKCRGNRGRSTHLQNTAGWCHSGPQVPFNEDVSLSRLDLFLENKVDLPSSVSV